MTSDLESAMFHLKKAGDCGVPKALYLLGCIHQQLPHSQLEQLTVEVHVRVDTRIKMCIYCVVSHAMYTVNRVYFDFKNLRVLHVNIRYK